MKNSFIFLTSFFLMLTVPFSFKANSTVGDSISVPRIIQPPVIDGAGTDLCWDSAAWNPMPYVWIPYGATIPAADFTGRFKTVWNEKQNLMYFLFEITDDIFVNGYVPNNGNYYMYDVIEIFIDENRSGGVHQTNNNAFAYHITAGNTTSEYDVMDMWGSGLENYKEHFPEYKRVRNGNLYTWEFSMMVLKDTFIPGDVPQDFKSTLQVDKRMGFSAAYCDDDHSSANPQRDHFIASKKLSQAESNDSYINASIFGLMKLVNEPTANPAIGIRSELSKDVKVNVYPNPVTESANLSFTNNFIGKVDISIFNMTGQLISTFTSNKTQSYFEKRISLNLLRSGIYFIKLNAGTDQMIVKVLK